MRRHLSLSYATPRESEAAPQQQALSFKSVALLFPPKDVLERVRQNTNGQGPVRLEGVTSLYDEDSKRHFPLAANKDVRIIIAQDDTGVSLNRLLYDSKAVRETKEAAASSIQKHAPRVFTFSRGPNSEVPSPRSSGFIRPHTALGSSTPTSPRSPTEPPPGSAGSFFGQSTLFRRKGPYVSLADARHEPDMPIEDSNEEMESWLDCVFGKSQMRYKGATTKVHAVERQPRDPKVVHWEQESQRGGFEYTPEGRNPPPKSRPEELVRLRRPALLVSRTFAVCLDGSHVSDCSCQSTAKLAEGSRARGAAQSQRGITPTFAVAMLIPLAKKDAVGASSPCDLPPSDQHAHLDTLDPAQVVMGNWHIVVRALDSLEACTKAHIYHELKDGVDTARGVARLAPKSLYKYEPLHQCAIQCASRLKRAMQIIEVSPQGGWNIWRDEIRDLTKMEKDVNPGRVVFLQLALTAALSSSLGWMRIFAPPQHQTRLHRENAQLRYKYDAVQTRTVVVARDQNRARHLIYLLAKLIPLNEPRVEFGRSRHNAPASTNVSALTQGLKAASQSLGKSSPGPATRVGSVRARASLTLPRPSPPRALSPVKQRDSSAASAASSLAKPNITRIRSRIDLSGKTTPAMPISSAPSSNYTTPDASPEARPMSSASAQSNLLRHLQRQGSAASDASTVWSSFASGTWGLSARRASTATDTSVTGLGNLTISNASNASNPPAGILKTGKSSLGRTTGRKLTVRMADNGSGVQQLRTLSDGRKDSAIQSPPSQRRRPRLSPRGSFTRELSYTFDSTEGVVDVDLTTSRNNKSERRYQVPDGRAAFPSVGADETTLKISPFGGPKCHAAYDRVAGYLETLHPDFALQAVKPYTSLLQDVKAAMKGERSPSFAAPTDKDFYPLERWAEICSTFIIDSDANTVKRLTLRRRTRYDLLTPNDKRSMPTANGETGSIKVMKSEDMETVRRTYRVDDQGKKQEWKDRRVVWNGSPDKDYMTQAGGSSASLSKSPEATCVERSSAASTIKGSVFPDSICQASARSSIASNGTLRSAPVQAAPLPDDLGVYIDRSTAGSTQQSTPVPRTRRVPIKNSEGKITGWKESDADGPEEAGMNDLPTSFTERRRERTYPVVYEQTLEEVFSEEIISKPDSAVVSVVEQMLAAPDTRSATHSRASSIHGRTHSRTNSINGASGLTELQHESKKIIEDALEGLVTNVANYAYESRPARTGTGLFGFRLGGSSQSETSVLRDAIAKWLADV